MMKGEYGMNLTEFSQEIHQNAIEHGWCEKPRTFGELIALCHAELSEALEEFRANRPMEYVDDTETGERITDPALFAGRKPEGISVEMADCLIRILDCAAEMGWDCDRVRSMGFLYAKVRDLPACIAELHHDLSDAWFVYNAISGGRTGLFDCASKIVYWLERNYGADWMDMVRRKHEFNKTRPYRHGGKRL